MICWKLYLISLFFVFSWLIVWADRISKCDRCLAVGRGDADPKCNLIISPFLTLPDLLDCLNFTRDAMPIVLLLKLMGDGLGGVGVDLYLGVGGGTGGGYYLIVFGFFSYDFVVCCVLFSVPLFGWRKHDGCWIFFFVFSLFSLSQDPLNRSYVCREIVLSVV